MSVFVKYNFPENNSWSDINSISNHRLVINDNLEDGTRNTDCWYEDNLPIDVNREYSNQTEFYLNIKQNVLQIHGFVSSPFSKSKILTSNCSYCISKEAFALHSNLSIDSLVLLKGESEITIKINIAKEIEGDTFIKKSTFQGSINSIESPVEMLIDNIYTIALSSSVHAKHLNVPFPIQSSYTKKGDLEIINAF